mmetsp:Transcript_99992/g.283210  ORF Transcript_99992/g.283210 Transcript_99992/m.283210 type:complete len:84 (-) Transcript_99992:793-1044(-)
MSRMRFNRNGSIPHVVTVPCDVGLHLSNQSTIPTTTQPDSRQLVTCNFIPGYKYIKDSENHNKKDKTDHAMEETINTQHKRGH